MYIHIERAKTFAIRIHTLF